MKHSLKKVKKIFQTTGEIISGLVDSKSDLNLKKPFQKAGQLKWKSKEEYFNKSAHKLEIEETIFEQINFEMK